MKKIVIVVVLVAMLAVATVATAATPSLHEYEEKYIREAITQCFNDSASSESFIEALGDRSRFVTKRAITVAEIFATHLRDSYYGRENELPDVDWVISTLNHSIIEMELLLYR